MEFLRSVGLLLLALCLTAGLAIFIGFGGIIVAIFAGVIVVAFLIDETINHYK